MKFFNSSFTVGALLITADRWTDRRKKGRTDLKKQIGTLCDNANAPRRVVVVFVGKID
jgi:hypothetical protein